MPGTTKSEKVPDSMRPVFDAITALTDKFCQEHLNDEYRLLARQAAAALCRKRPSPAARGNPAGWACGILYALGHANFLFDKTQTPHMQAIELCERFGVSQSTGAAKAKTVRNALKISQLDPDWCLPSKLKDNPLVWLVSLNGFVVDVRMMPREVQEIVFKKGLIPYIPAADGTPAPDQSLPEIAPAGKAPIYHLKVTLEGIEPPIWRCIQVPGDYTLFNLHCVLQVVMGWEECHLHQFNVGEDRYSTSYGDDDDLDDGFVEDNTVTLAQIAPEEGMRFTYTYDFGDRWRHDILVWKILAPTADAVQPACLGGERACPPENCGGIWGYDELLKAIRDPQHPEHDGMLEWLGGSFDPEAFDVSAVNHRLKQWQADGHIR